MGAFSILTDCDRVNVPQWVKKVVNSIEAFVQPPTEGLWVLAQ